MLIVDLPVIPRVLVLPERVFRRVVLAWFVHCAGRPGGLENSQRQICSRFNRSNREIIGSYLKEAREFGFLKLLTPSDGLNPDVHTRGAFFENRTRDSDRLIQLANSLWGSHRGLLSQWPYPTAWGHGCTPPAAILCLATLSILDEPIQRKRLRQYLEPLVPESSFNEAVRWMRDRQLVEIKSCGLTTSLDWENRLTQHLASSRAGQNRLERGNERRRRESEQNRARVKKATISRLEKDALKKLPCVWKGCQNYGHEMEHFPPRRFIGHLEDQTNRFLVWAICEKHNDETQSFIKGLPRIPLNHSGRVFIDARCTEFEIYRAAANRQIQRFYNAYEIGNGDLAVDAIVKTVSLSFLISDYSEKVNASASPRRKEIRRKRGRNCSDPSMSQL